MRRFPRPAFRERGIAGPRARRANARGRRWIRLPPACAAEGRGRQSRCRFVASKARGLPDGASAFGIGGAPPAAKSAFAVGEARRAIARSRGGRRRSRDCASADSLEKPAASPDVTAHKHNRILLVIAVRGQPDEATSMEKAKAVASKVLPNL